MKYFFLVFVFLLNLQLAAQKKAQIELVRAKSLKPVVHKGKKIQKLNGDVVLRHSGTTMYCDSAYLDDGANIMDAFGSVHISDRDSLHLYGDLLNYNGNTGVAEVHNNVRMTEKDMTLRTEHINYNLRTKVAQYYAGGIINDKENQLTSKIGIYYKAESQFYFQKNVVLTNPKYIMYSDTLIYSLQSEIAFFHGPTTIVSDENKIYCEKGWYNTATNQARMQKNTILKNLTQELHSDSLFYDRNIKFGQAYKNVTLIDTVKNIILKGNFAQYYEGEGKSFFTDRSQAIFINADNDSLFLHADTLRLELDENKKANIFMAYNKVKFFKPDLQGKCDSMVYRLKDSLFIMYNSPLVWGSKSQLSGKKIRVIMQKGKINKIYIDTNAFVLQHDSLEYYNQVSGRNIISHFSGDKLHHVDVIGNAQTVYFAREEDRSLIGVNLGSASDMRVDFSESGVNNIVYLGKPKASLNPVKKVSKRALYLRGFKNYDHWRPKTKEEIFTWEPKKENN